MGDEEVLKSDQIYILQKKSLSTPETFDITDISLATQPLSPPNFFLLPNVLLFLIVVGQHHWPLLLPPSRGLPEVGVRLEVHPWPTSVPSPLLLLPQVLLLGVGGGGDHGHHHRHHLPRLNLVC